MTEAGLRLRDRYRVGFTLTEVLVVTAITTVLIAMLLPVLSLARESARTTVCLSNLRQIGAALQGYAADHSGYLVPGDHWGRFDGYPWLSGGSWADVLVARGYLRAPTAIQTGPRSISGQSDMERPNVFRCPSGSPSITGGLADAPASQSSFVGALPFGRIDEIAGRLVFSWYGANASLRQDLFGPPYSPFRVLPDEPQSVLNPDWRLNKLSQFKQPALLPLIYDGVSYFNGVPANINARHGGQKYTNILFADGHAETQLTSGLPNENWYLH